jgi:hypothetical protein
VIAYVQGHLSGPDQASFEQNYALSPRRHAKIQRARVLVKMQEISSPSLVPKLRSSVPFAIAAVAIFGILATPLLHYWRANRTMVINVESAAGSRDHNGSPSGEQAQVPYRIGSITATVRFAMEPTDTIAQSFLVTLSAPSGVVVSSVQTRSNDARVYLDVPVSKLSTGIFDLTITGLSPDGSSTTSEEFRFELRTQ